MSANEDKPIDGPRPEDAGAPGGAASGSSGSVLSHADADTAEGKSAPEAPEKKPMGDRLAKIKARQAREAAQAKPLAGVKRGSAEPSEVPHMEAVGRKSKIFRPAQAAGPAVPPIKPPPVGPGGRICLHCHTQKTPLWRNGPLGPKTLCNACGVRFKLGKLQPNPNSSIPAHVTAAAMQGARAAATHKRASPAKKKLVPRAARTARGAPGRGGHSSSDEDDGGPHGPHRRASWGRTGGGGAIGGRMGAGGDPELVCAVCEDPADDDDEPLARCAGLCGRDFHADCLSPADAARLSLCADGPAGGEWKCSDCRRQVHECFHCKQRDPDRLLRRCSAPGCGKFYHFECLEDLPLARTEGGARLVCPLHVCAGCGEPARARERACCVRCPRAFHLKCLGSPGSRGRHLTRHHLVCEAHGPPPSQGRTGPIGLFDYSDHTAAMLLMALAGVY